MDNLLENAINVAKQLGIGASNVARQIAGKVSQVFNPSGYVTKHLTNIKNEADQQNAQYQKLVPVAKQYVQDQVSKFNFKLPEPTPIKITNYIGDKYNDFLKFTENQKLTAGGVQLPVTYGQATRAVRDYLVQPALQPLIRTRLTATGQQAYQPQGQVEQFLLGKEPVKNWQGQFGDFSQGMQDFGVPKGTADFVAPPLALGMGLLDMTPFGMGKGKVASMASKEGKLILEALPAAERAKWSANSLNWLIKAGFPKGVAETITTPQAAYIIKNGIKPSEWNGLAKAEKAVMSQIPELKGVNEAYKTWVNARMATRTEGLIAKGKFTQFDNLGMQGVFDFQEGLEKQKFKEVKRFFDDKFNELNRAGIDVNYHKNYLPQLWANTAEEVERVYKALGTKPSFSLQRLISDYKTGIAAGLTPRFNNISSLVAWYESYANKVLADKEFFDYLKKGKFILPDGKAPNNWQTLDPDHFPKFKATIDGKQYNGTYKAEPELARLINNYLVDPENWMAKAAEITTRVKNIGLAGGIPKTGFNFHGVVNLFARDLLSSNNPMAAILRDPYWLARPSAAEKYVMENLEDLAFFQKHGLTASVEDWDKFRRGVKSSSNKLMQGVQKGEEKWDSWFGDPLFKQIVPAFKLSLAKSQYKSLVKVMSKEEAAKKAAHIANNIFGGINLDELGRDKNTQNLLRTLFLAPDWAETTLRTGKGVLWDSWKHPKSPQFQAYRTFARNYTLAYIAQNLLNKILSGHWMFQNERGKEFEVDTGTYEADGTKRYWNTFGTAVDFVRLPVQAALGLLHGDPSALIGIVGNRLSMPLGAGLHLLGNQDYLHRPIYGNDKYGNPIPAEQVAGGIWNEVSQGVGVPVQIRAAVDYATGKSTGEEAIVQGLELPIRYRGGAYSDKDKELVEDLQSINKSGEEIAGILEQKRGSKKDSIKQDQGIVASTVNFFKGLFGSEEPEKTYSSNPILAMAQKNKEKDEQAAKRREILELGLDDEETQKLLDENDLGSLQDATDELIKRTEIGTGERGEMIQYLLTQKNAVSNEEYLKEVDRLVDKDILTKAVVTEWFERGVISLQEQEVLNTLITQFKTNQAQGGGTGAKPKKLKLLPVKKLRPSVPKLGSSSIKISTPKTLNFKPTQQLQYRKLGKGSYK